MEEDQWACVPVSDRSCGGFSSVLDDGYSEASYSTRRAPSAVGPRTNLAHMPLDDEAQAAASGGVLFARRSRQRLHTIMEDEVEEHGDGEVLGPAANACYSCRP